MKMDDKDVGLLVGGVVALAAIKKLRENVGGIDATNVFSATAGAVADGTTEALGAVWDGMVTGLEFTAVTTALVGGLTIGTKLIQEDYNKRVAIWVSPSVEKDTKPERIEKLASSFSYTNRGWIMKLMKGRVWFRYLIIKNKFGKVSFGWLVPEDVSGRVLNNLREYYPDAAIGIDYDFKIPVFEGGKGGHMKLAVQKNPFTLREKLENNVGSIINALPNESVIDIVFSPPGTQNNPVTKGVKKLFNLPVGKNPAHEVYDVVINIWSKGSPSKITSQLQQHLKGDGNGLIYRSYWLFGEQRSGVGMSYAPPWRRMKMREVELGQLLFHPPIDNKRAMEAIEAVFEKIKPRAKELNRGIRIGFADHEDLLPRKDENGKRPIEKVIDEGRPICLNLETMDRHGIVPGATGAGKGGFIASAFGDGFLEAWALGKLQAGFTLLDPHESAVLVIINRLQELEKKGVPIPWEKVRVYSFDPGCPYPTPLNLLHYSDRYKASNSQKAEEITEIIMKSFGGELSKSKVLLASAIEALLDQGGERTIADIPNILRNVGFLNRAIAKMKNEFVRDEILTPIRDALADPNKGKEPNIDALITRLFPFIGNMDMRKFFCHRHNVIDGHRIIENGEIVLISFKNAPTNMYRLGGSWLANHYYSIFKSRKPYTGKHHYFVADEADLFGDIDVFPKMMKEIRKFHGGLTLLTQDAELLHNDIKNVMKQNLGYMLTLRQNKDNSIKQTIEVMNNLVTDKQIRNLEDNTGILYSLDGKASVMFPPPAYIWNGERQPKSSRGATLADKAANKKFMELIERDCAPVEEEKPAEAIEPEPAQSEVAAATEEKQPVAVGAEAESFGDLD
jgi:hypothetical protein